MNGSMLASLSLGFVLGVKHATEADHLAAVSTIVTQSRSIRESAFLGALWGAGHTGALLLVGFCVIGLGVAIPERVANILELGVALMIVILGMRLLRIHVHTHKHSGGLHTHLHFEHDQHTHEGHEGLEGWRPVLIGIMHGLAGSAALTLLVLTEVMRTAGPFVALAYLAVFGIGSIGGMLVMSSIIGLPFTLGRNTFYRAIFPLRITTGVFSASFGVVYALKVISKLAIS